MKYVQGEDGVWREPPGYEALWGWFGLSYASWLTLPRVLMHEMPDDWQARMAQLLEEWAAHWDIPNELCELIPQVNAKRGNKFTKWPEFILDYRHPDEGAVEALKARAYTITEAGKAYLEGKK
jgi:hypothetical protein